MWASRSMFACFDRFGRLKPCDYAIREVEPVPRIKEGACPNDQRLEMCAQDTFLRYRLALTIDATGRSRCYNLTSGNLSEICAVRPGSGDPGQGYPSLVFHGVATAKQRFCGYPAGCLKDQDSNKFKPSDLDVLPALRGKRISYFRGDRSRFFWSATLP